MTTLSPSAEPLQTSIDLHLSDVVRSGRWPQIGAFVSDLLRSGSFDELQCQFRRAIAHFGYFGYAYWGASPTTRFSLCGKSDLSDRFGKHTGDCSGLMETVFRHYEPAVRARDNAWKAGLHRPVLECTDSPAETRDIHRHLCRSVAELDVAPYEDVLLVPTSVRTGSGGRSERHHIHLPLFAGVGPADIVAGVSLAKIFDSLAQRMLVDDTARVEPADEPAVELTPNEKVVLRWAAAGKTHAEIARKTGMRRGEVRYHLDKARNRYGFATSIQAIVQAAKDHDWAV